MGQFDRTVEEIVTTPSSTLGFESIGRARFERRTDRGLRHLLIFDPASASPRRVRIFVVVNSVELDTDEGGHLVRYFTGGSLSSTPRDLQVQKQAELVAALRRFTTCLSTVVEPWLQLFQRPSDLAAELTDPNLDIYRAELHALEGDRAATERETAAYVARMRMGKFSLKQVAEAEDHAKAVLARLRTLH